MLQENPLNSELQDKKYARITLWNDRLNYALRAFLITLAALFVAAAFVVPRYVSEHKLELSRIQEFTSIVGHNPKVEVRLNQITIFAHLNVRGSECAQIADAVTDYANKVRELKSREQINLAQAELDGAVDSFTNCKNDYDHMTRLFVHFGYNVPNVRSVQVSQIPAI